MLSKSLLAFVVVAEELHFGRAAQRLHISQPPLSQQIRQFEQEVGAVLFVRTTRSVRLTAAGKQMLERARQLMQEVDATLHTVRQYGQGEQGLLKLGFTHSTVYGALPRVLRTFRDAYPEVVLELSQKTSDVLLEDLQAGRLDVALLRFSPSMTTEGLSTRVIEEDPVVLVMPLRHELAQHQKVPVAALHGVAWVGFDPVGARYFHELEEAVLASAQARPNVRHISLLPTLLALVEAGMGLSLVPASAVQQSEGRLVWRELDLPAGAGPFNAVLSCAWREDSGNPVVEHLIRQVTGLA